MKIVEVQSTIYQVPFYSNIFERMNNKTELRNNRQCQLKLNFSDLNHFTIKQKKRQFKTSKFSLILFTFERTPFRGNYPLKPYQFQLNYRPQPVQQLNDVVFIQEKNKNKYRIYC